MKNLAHSIVASPSGPAPTAGALRSLRLAVGIALCFLLAASFPSSLGAEILQASYPFVIDLADATGNYADASLSGSPPPTPPSVGSPLCHNGVYFFDYSGQDIRTPVISSLDSTDFQVDIDFNLTALPAATPFQAFAPVIMGGNSWRWIGFYVDSSGLVGAKYNNSNFTWSATSVGVGVWYEGQLRYEAGTLQIVLDGLLIHEATVGPLNIGPNNLNFTTNDFSNGRALNGCIRNLDIYNDTTLLSATELVAIDIKPGSEPNAINPRSKGKIPVAILTTSTAAGDPLDFDAWNVDVLSLAFGPDGAGIAHSNGHAEDVDGDGDLDMVVHFKTRDTGITCGDTEATLTGETIGGQAIEGTDSVKTAGCKSATARVLARGTAPNDRIADRAARRALRRELRKQARLERGLNPR